LSLLVEFRGRDATIYGDTERLLSMARALREWEERGAEKSLKGKS